MEKVFNLLNMALLWRREVLNYGHFYKDSVIFCQKQWKKKEIQNIGGAAERAGSPATPQAKMFWVGRAPLRFGAENHR